MGRSRTVSYNFAATARVAGSAGKSRFRSSMGSLTPLDAALARPSHLFWRSLEVPTPRHPVLAPTEKSTDRRNIRSTREERRRVNRQNCRGKSDSQSAAHPGSHPSTRDQSEQYQSESSVEEDAP